MNVLLKLVVGIALVMAFAFSLSNIANASVQQETQKQVTVTLTIHHVSYDYRFGEYIAITNEDSEQGIWVFDLVQNKPYKQSSIEWLNKKYVDKKVELTYIGDTNIDDEVEIVKVKWLK